jgi:hypothetical protein
VVVTRLFPVLLLLLLAGCGGSAHASAPDVQVAVGAQKVPVHPTQYCLDDKGQRYSTTPPIIEVAPDAGIAITVPDDVAARGWGIQVFDEKLATKLGAISVPKGQQAYTDITTSDVVPPAFYLVIVENTSSACGGLSGAWPVGFLRAGGTSSSSSGSSSAASSAPKG